MKMNQPTDTLALFEPLPWQVKPWRDTSPTLLFTGSAGGGKSRLAGEKIHGFCLRYPRTTALVLRKAYAYASKSIVPFLRQTVISNDSHVQYRKGDRTFLYGNGSVIYAGGMRDEDQREAIRSIGGEGRLDIVWMEEANAFIESDYNEVLARMRGVAAPWTQVILTTNPDAPTHWIKRRLIDDGGAVTYYSSAEDNPHNPTSYAERLGELTGILYERLVLGLWKQAEGTVYNQFDSQIHVVEPFAIPADWRKVRAVDFGFVNAFVCQWWTMDNDGRMYLYREVYYTKRLVEDHARDIIRLSEGEAIETTVCDHDAEDRATLERYGVSTVGAWKSVSPGIQAVQSRLRKAGDGRPRLFVFRAALVEVDRSLETERKPTRTEQEFYGYVWSDKIAKETPVKVNDHGMDATRYAVAYVDDVGKERKPPPSGAQVEGLRLHRQKERPSRWTRSSSRVRR